MSEQNRAQWFPQKPSVNLRELTPGVRVKLFGDVIVEVLENPEDGMWIRGRYVSVPGNPAVEGTEEQIFAGDVVDIA